LGRGSHGGNEDVNDKAGKSYPVSKGVVWAHLINDELMSEWCMPCKGFALKKGQEFVFEIAPSVFFGGIFYNKILDFNEGEFLSYECAAAKPKLTTVVKWMLAEEGGETKLILEHSGFMGSQWLTKMMLAGGWKKMMNKHLHDKLQAR